MWEPLQFWLGSAEMRGKMEIMSIMEHGYSNPICIGQGSFGKVYRVLDVKTGKEYACKISLQTDMLEREGRVLAQIKHPLFPLYHASWQKGEHGFLVMEYVPGESLGRLVKRRGCLSPKCITEIVRELAEGLAFLHEQQVPIFFRDLKPDNVRIRQDGRVKLLDFGCACLEGENTPKSVGSLGFAPPEQLTGKGRTTAASDVYGLGRLICFMITGGVFFTYRKDGKKDIERSIMQRSGARKSILHKNIAQRKLLWKLMKESTCENPEERIPGMRIILFRLSKKCTKASLFSNVFCRKYKFHQNIWKTSYKFNND